MAERISDAEDNAHHLSVVIDASGLAVRVPGQCAEVGHPTVLPEEGMPLTRGVHGIAHHLALAIDGSGQAERVSRQRSEVSNLAVVPQGGVAVECADHLARVVDGPSGTEPRRQCAEVDRGIA
jgi:hypothetical protein